ncbi:MAG: D-serine ammonia-lyase [Clostridia bacterium]|nr:D-serine ammonia-lyase [Clostridia bacterium]
MNKEIINDMQSGQEVFFCCTKETGKEILTQEDIDDAWERMKRFSQYVKVAFPETEKTDGMIDSPVRLIHETKKELECKENVIISGDLYVKRDDCLAVCGSLKARGGIYTVFKYAEDIAIRSGMLKTTDNYAVLNNEEFRQLFSRYKISVGSTGNLGMSIGLSGSKLGFDVTVYMSEEAKTWKKNMLKNAGVNVIEFEGDYTSALKLARNEAAKDANTYFVDDEDSKELFLGYSVAYKTLLHQLEEEGVIIDDTHPLLVYLPCGVGGGPGGITFGLKETLGENVYCFFGEPTQMPCMALAMAEGRGDVSVYDIGLGNGTIADGLACSSPSILAYEIMKTMLDGCFTIRDEHSLELSRLLYRTSGIKAEPSSCVALGGVGKMMCDIENIQNATHLVWLTGGSLVPEEEWERIGLYK